MLCTNNAATRRVALAGLTVTLLVGACSDSTSPTNKKSGGATLENALRSALILSEPIRSNFGYFLKSASATDSQATFVSMRPGSLLGLDSVVLALSIAPQVTVSTGYSAGGFDPIPIYATVGDSLDATAFWRGVASTIRVAVPAFRPPTVLRSSPSAGRANVELGQQVWIVFSQPIDSATATSSSIQLLLRGAAEASTVRLQTNQPWVVILSSKTLLAPEATYDVVVGSAVADVSDEQIQAPVSFDFQTGTSSGMSLEQCDSATTSNSALALGIYRLTTINGAPPPYTIPPVPDEEFIVTGGSLALGSDRSYSFTLNLTGNWAGYRVAPGYTRTGPYQVCGDIVQFYATTFNEGAPTTSLFFFATISPNALRSTVRDGITGSDSNDSMDWIFTRVP